jgi:hypothetical protein
MPEKFTDAAGWLWAAVAAFGAFGGFAKFLHEVSENRRRFSWAGLICYGVISGFCGMLFGLLAAWNDLGLYPILFSAGVAGGIGWGTLDLLQWAIRAKVRRAVQEPIPAGDDDAD